MEIEFAVQIDPERRRHAAHAALAFLSATTLAFILVGLIFPPIAACIAGLLIPAAMEITSNYRAMRRQARSPDVLRLGWEQTPLHFRWKNQLCDGIAANRTDRRRLKNLHERAPPLLFSRSPFFYLKFLRRRSGKNATSFSPGLTPQ